MISVIITCFNGARYVNQCLDSVIASSYERKEIIVIDDYSSDNSFDLLKKYKKKGSIMLMGNQRNIGASTSRNIAARCAHGSILFFLDIDTIINKDCLNAVGQFFSSHPECGLIQGQLLKNEHELDSIGHFISISGFPYEIGAGEDPSRFQHVMPILGAKSAGMGVRKSLFDLVHGFDEDYIIYGEDTDLSWRIALTGHTNYYLPTASILHAQKSSMSKQTSQRIFYEGAKNTIHYLIKNASLSIMLWIVPLHIIVWLCIGLSTCIRGNFASACSIGRGIWWNVLHLDKTLKKRRYIHTLKKGEIESNILFGPATFTQIIKKGWRWIAHV